MAGIFSDVFTKSLSKHISVECGFGDVDLLTSAINKFSLSREVFQEDSTSKSSPGQKSRVLAKTTRKVEKDVLKKAAPEHTCAHEWKSRGKIGTVCGKTATIEIAGQWYCGSKKEDGSYTVHARSAHLAEKTNETKKAKSKVDKECSGKKNTLEESKNAKDAKSSRLLNSIIQNKKVSVRKNIHGQYIHDPTGMVIRPPKDVLGLVTDDPKVLNPLQDEHVKICEANGWKFDPKIVAVTEVELKEDLEYEEVYIDDEGNPIDDDGNTVDDDGNTIEFV